MHLIGSFFDVANSFKRGRDCLLGYGAHSDDFRIGVRRSSSKITHSDKRQTNVRSPSNSAVISDQGQRNPAVGLATSRQGSTEESRGGPRNIPPVPVFFHSVSAQAHSNTPVSVHAEPIALDISVSNPEFIEVTGEVEAGGQEDNRGVGFSVGVSFSVGAAPTGTATVSESEALQSQSQTAESIADNISSDHSRDHSYEHVHTHTDVIGHLVPAEEEPDLAIAIREDPVDYASPSIGARLAQYQIDGRVQEQELAYQTYSELQRAVRRERLQLQGEEYFQRARRNARRSASVLTLVVATAIAITLLTKAE